MCERLAGKNALITGGSRGIGYAIAVQYAREGAGVALLSRSEESLEAAARRLAEDAPGSGVLTEAADVTSLDEVGAALRGVLDAMDHVDVLVNAAGIASLGDIDAMPPAEWRRMIEVNLLGSYHVCRAVWPHMKARGSGSIVLVIERLGPARARGLERLLRQQVRRDGPGRRAGQGGTPARHPLQRPLPRPDGHRPAQGQLPRRGPLQAAAAGGRRPRGRLLRIGRIALGQRAGHRRAAGAGLSGAHSGCS